MEVKKIIHILRNPYGWDEVDKRTAQCHAADLIEASVPKADLRKLVENWRVYQANFCDKSNYDEYIYNRGRTYGVCADELEKLIGGE